MLVVVGKVAACRVASADPALDIHKLAAVVIGVGDLDCLSQSICTSFFKFMLI